MLIHIPFTHSAASSSPDRRLLYTVSLTSMSSTRFRYVSYVGCWTSRSMPCNCCFMYVFSFFMSPGLGNLVDLLKWRSCRITFGTIIIYDYIVIMNWWWKQSVYLIIIHELKVKMNTFAIFVTRVLQKIDISWRRLCVSSLSAVLPSCIHKPIFILINRLMSKPSFRALLGACSCSASVSTCFAWSA